MNVYTALSKKIGFSSGQMLVPKSSVCEQLLKEVNEGSLDAFETVFRIQRFAITPTDTDGIVAMKFISEAFFAGSKIWQNRYVGKTYSKEQVNN